MVAALATACGGGPDRSERPPPRAAATTEVRRPAEDRRPEPPAPRERLPSRAPALAGRLATVSAELDDELDRWRATRPGRRAVPPRDVVLRALYVQRASRLLARRPALAAAVLRRLPPGVRADVRDAVRGLRSLFTLTSLATERRFRAGAPTPPGLLRSYYREAQRRFGVHWHVLAAIHMIESNFGRLRNVSNAGAVGPMQFLPSTWAAYGMGGDIRDPRDAILGAASLLRASGAPASHARALYAYNPSDLYVEAVLSFARRIARNRHGFLASWSWQSFQRTREGERQLTGPGAG